MLWTTESNILDSSFRGSGGEFADSKPPHIKNHGLTSRVFNLEKPDTKAIFRIRAGLN